MSFEVVCRTCDFSETVEKRPFANAYRIDHRTKHPDHDVDFQEVAPITDGGRDVREPSPGPSPERTETIEVGGRVALATGLLLFGLGGITALLAIALVMLA